MFSPEQVILNRIAAYASEVASTNNAPPPTNKPGEPEIVYVGDRIDLSTVQFVKHRLLPQRQVHMVTYQRGSLGKVSYLYLLIQDTDSSWRIAVETGGNVSPIPLEATGRPWANLAGGSGTFGGVWGGLVTENAGIARVQLVDASGLVLEDSVDDNIVLFLTNQAPAKPLTARLYDALGNLVSTHPV